MNAAQRDKFISEFLQTHSDAVLHTKGTEYSRGEEDVNSNFKRVAIAIGADPVQIAFVYLMKHLDSIAFYVKTRESPSGEHIYGRIGDAINYLLILAALINEEEEKQAL